MKVRQFILFIPAFTVRTCVTMNWKMMGGGCQVDKQGFPPRDGKSIKILHSQKFEAKRIAQETHNLQHIASRIKIAKIPLKITKLQSIQSSNPHQKFSNRHSAIITRQQAHSYYHGDSVCYGTVTCSALAHFHQLSPFCTVSVAQCTI